MHVWLSTPRTEKMRVTNAVVVAIMMAACGGEGGSGSRDLIHSEAKRIMHQELQQLGGKKRPAPAWVDPGASYSSMHLQHSYERMTEISDIRAPPPGPSTPCASSTAEELTDTLEASSITSASPIPTVTNAAPGWVKYGFFAVVLAFLIAFFIDSLTTKRLYGALEGLFEWIKGHSVLGPLVFVSVVILFSFVCVPESVLTIGGSWIFTNAHGVWRGIVLTIALVYFGIMFGALGTFLIARYLIHGTVQRWMDNYPIVKALDKSLRDDGARIVVLLRLTPFLPFNIFNYVMGATSVSLRNFLIGSAIGAAPWVVTCSYIGSAANGVSDIFTGRHEESRRMRIVKYVMYAVCGVATLLLIYLVSMYTKRAFHTALREAQLSRLSGRLAEDDELGEVRGAPTSSTPAQGAWRMQTFVQERDTGQEWKCSL